MTPTGAVVMLLLLAAAATPGNAADGDNSTYHLVGCFEGSNVLSHRALQSDTMTYEVCHGACSSKNYAYFGMLEADICLCGNDQLSESNKLKDRTCGKRCKGDRDFRCGKDTAVRVFQFGPEVQPVPEVVGGRLYKPTRTALLFSIGAHSGKIALDEYKKAGGSNEVVDAQQARTLFRSGNVDRLADLVKQLNLRHVVLEMRNSDNAVLAQTVFEVVSNSAGIDQTNWFCKERLVSSYPFWIGNQGNFLYFSIDGRDTTYQTIHHYRRSFHIKRSDGNCSVDTGLIGVAEQRYSGYGECSWIEQGTRDSVYPALFYSREADAPFEKSVGFADYMVIFASN